ncbi:MAG TPA: hypothetical protein VHE60_02860 [Pyrinomonadaceae bacterium]|nr:hypothetical protein [Pyrinomonadaceae bacterium]
MLTQWLFATMYYLLTSWIGYHFFVAIVGSIYNPFKMYPFLKFHEQIYAEFSDDKWFTLSATPTLVVKRD